MFPPTRITWSATLSAEDWFACNDKAAPKVSLKPEGMDTRKCEPFLPLRHACVNINSSTVSTVSSIQQVPVAVKKPTDHSHFGSKSEYESNKQQEVCAISLSPTLYLALIHVLTLADSEIG